MAEETLTGIMRDFVRAMAAGEAERTISYLTDDVVSITPYGTLKGKEAFKNNVATMAKNMTDMAVKETGNGIVAQGDKAFFEHVISGKMNGKHFEMLAMCAYEFRGDKIKSVRTVYDRLLTAQQVVKGWPATPLVNMIVRQSEKAMK